MTSAHKETVAQAQGLIEDLLAARNEGTGIAALQDALAMRGLRLSRRSLQRRLDSLLAEQRIVSSGASRATVYKFNPSVRAISQGTSPMPQLRAEGGPYVPLSQAGLEIRDAIRRPLGERRPTGYEQAFLDAYRPNEDFYLTTEQRARLMEAGRTAPEDRPAGTYARDILNRLLIDLSWASSRLEGNTYSLLDTQRLVELGESASGSSARDTQMILNHKKAIEMIVGNAAEIGFNRYTILNLHAILSDNLLADPRAIGRLRTRSVAISGSTYLPLAVPQQLEDCFIRVLGKAALIADPFEQAFFCMVHLPYLQPFEDVNKRVSRLAANIPLVQRNLCPLSFVDVPEQAYVEGTVGVYELRRVELLRDVFTWAYERSCQRYLLIRQSIGEPDAFRLKYRNALEDVVQSVVRGKLRGDPSDIVRIVGSGVPGHDMPSFIDMVLSDLQHLYEGNIARYQLRPSEFSAWPFKRTYGG